MTDRPAESASAGLIESRIRHEARALGLDPVGIAPAVQPGGFPAFCDWLGRGFAGEMRYLEARREAYADPGSILDGVRSVIMAGLNYRTVAPPQRLDPGQGRVSRYAWGRGDYHAVLKRKLRALGETLHELVPGCRTRAVVDTAPLLERDFARLAGLGWFGKNTMLIHKRLGSWLFLGALLTDAELVPDQPHESSHCGTCTRCLEACPTGAFPEPYVLDATRCLAYFTIELRDQPIPEAYRDACREWLFGCDVCNDVCPWNRKAPVSSEPAFQPLRELCPAEAADLLSLDEASFRARFSGSPLLRAGRAGLLRNACIVLGNTGDASHLPRLEVACEDSDALVREAAAWGLARLRTRVRRADRAGPP